MQYLLLIYTAESVDDNMTESEMGKLMEGYMRFGTELEAAGAHVGSNRLHPIGSATSINQRNGEFTLTDGPFAETKEQLGGYYLIEAASLDEAITWAKKIPSVQHGTIEVRPIWSMGADDSTATDAAAKTGA